MTERVNPVGWQIIAGHVWAVPPNLVPAVQTVTEARNFQHQTPDLTQDNGDDWLLVCHFRTGIRFRVGRGPWRDREPAVWHLYPSTMQWAQDTRKARLPLHGIWVRFLGGERTGLQRLIHPSHGFAQFRDPASLLLEQVRSMTAIAEARKEDGYYAVMSGFMTVVETLLKATRVDDETFEITRTGQMALHDPLVLKVRQYIAGHFQSQITREVIASHVGSSISTVERHHLASMGESLMKTVMRLRISKAKELLVGGLTVKEVAEQTGFYDAFHFSKAFKRVEGVAPSQYIKNTNRHRG